eukprot:374935_1
MHEKYNGKDRHTAIPILITFINYMHIKVAPREVFNPTEDIHIYLYATKDISTKIIHLLHQNHQRNLSLIFWAWSTWSMRTFTIFPTSETTTRSLGKYVYKDGIWKFRKKGSNGIFVRYTAKRHRKEPKQHLFYCVGCY